MIKINEVEYKKVDTEVKELQMTINNTVKDATNIYFIIEDRIRITLETKLSTKEIDSIKDEDIKDYIYGISYEDENGWNFIIDSEFSIKIKEKDNKKVLYLELYNDEYEELKIEIEEKL